MSTPQGPHGTPRRGDDADTPQAPDEPDWGTPPAGGWGGGWPAEPQAGQGWGSAGRDQGEQAGYGSPQHGAQHGQGQYEQARYDQAGYDQPQQPGYGSQPGEQHYGGQEYRGRDAGPAHYANRAPEDGGEPAWGQPGGSHRVSEQQWAPVQQGDPEQQWDSVGGGETGQGRGGDRQGRPDGPVDPGRRPAWSGEQGWSPEHGTQGPPDEQAWAGHQGRPGQQGGEAPTPPARDPREAQGGSRRSPGRPGRSALPFVIGGAVLVLLVAAAVVLFVTPGYLTTRTFDQGALNQGVTRILQQDYKLGATDVSCPSGVEVAPGDAFTCDAKVDGEAVKVPVTILDEDGTYQVGRV
jgi:hypothetical protein